MVNCSVGANGNNTATAKQMKYAQRNGKKTKESTRERNKVYLSCSDDDDGWYVFR